MFPQSTVTLMRFTKVSNTLLIERLLATESGPDRAAGTYPNAQKRSLVKLLPINSNDQKA